LLAAAGRLTGAGTAVHLGLVYDFPSPVFRNSVRRIRLGLAPSPHTASAWIQRGWPASSIQVIPNGVDTRVFNSAISRTASRQMLGGPEPDQPLVAYVGRLVREKGIFTLLRAFASHRQAGGAGHLLLAGHAPGQEVAELGQLAGELKLPADAWEVRPPTSQPETVYRAADVVVVPSEWDEPFGLVPLEAMACGTLAVVSDRGIMPEFVAPVGHDCVFPAGDAGALSARLTHWLSEAGARERAASILAAHTREHYDFARCGDAYLEAFAASARR
jgi:glycosyltransferase involved in cell wall biosynthesis